MRPSSESVSSSTRPRSTALGAFLEGWRRAIRAPHVVVGILAATIAVTLPLTLALHDAVETQLGASLVADGLARGWNAAWADEFVAGQSGVGATLTHEILGFGGIIATFSRVADAEPLPASLIGAVAAYLAISIFLSGGIIDRLARARPLGATVFLSTCARFVMRLVRLTIVAGAAYWVLFRWVHPLLMQVILPRVAGADAIEPRIVAWRVAGYLVFLSLVAGVTLIVDMARVRLVVEDRRSVLSAIASGARFVRRRPGRMIGLFLLNLLGQAILARLFLQVAPSADMPTWVVLLATETYVVARVWARLAFIGSEVTFFQGELAHATYTAPPPPRWPDSASVEALRAIGRS